MQNAPRGAFCNTSTFIKLPFAIKISAVSFLSGRFTQVLLYCIHISVSLSSPVMTLNSHWHVQFSETHNIRIHLECEDGIEKSVSRITDWHHEACRVMPNGDREERIFLSHPHTNHGLFFLHYTNFLILYWKNMKRLVENPEFGKMRHGDVILTLQ